MKLIDINQFGPMIGMSCVPESVTFLEIWQGLHHRALHWNLPPEGKTIEDHQFSINFDDRNMCVTLEKNVLSENWYSLCNAIGMTVYGAVALSWCKDAELFQVWEGWEASDFPLKPLPEYERPARFINPALLPTTNSLTDLVKFAENKSLPICAMIVALKEPLQFDLPDDQLRAAGPQVASFLKSRMLQKSDRTAAETSLIEVWSQTVKGTDFDIWERA